MEKSEYTRMYTLETSFWWYRVLHELVETTIQKQKPKGKIRILDAGCGTGRMMEICQKYGKVEGIDYSTDAVDYARKRGLDNVHLGDLNEVQLQPGSYDIIVSLDVLYHAAIKNDRAIVEKFYDALKEGGLLIINLPAFDYLKRSHDIVVHAKKRYRKKAFKKELKEAGFSNLHSSYRMPLLYFIILITKIFHPKPGAQDSESDLKEIPRWLNRLLLSMGRAENWLIRRGIPLPVGSSLFVVAK
ncbi:MAG: class I SAM-dependent methyltransferase, partial [Methylococcaceae bacterium]